MMMGSISKLSEGIGVESAWIAAKIFNSLSVAKKAFSGKEYNRGIEAIKKTYQSLMEVVLKAYTKDVEATGTEAEQSNLTSCRDALSDVREGGPTGHAAVHGDASKRFCGNLEAWEEKQAAASGTTKFLVSIKRAITTMFAFIRASRDCETAGIAGFLGAMRAFTPYMSVADRLLHLRMLTMQDCLIIHEREKCGNGLADLLKSGRLLGIQRTDGEFNMVWADMHLEQYSNRYAKMVLDRAAARRGAYFAAVACTGERAQVLIRLTDMVAAARCQPNAVRREQRNGPRWQAWRQNRQYRRHVVALTAILEDVVEPVPGAGDEGIGPGKVAHLTSKIAATSAVAKSMTNIESDGAELWRQFQARMDPNSAKTVWDKVSKSGYKSFASQTKTSARQKKGTSLQGERSRISYILRCLAVNDGLPDDQKITPLFLAKYELCECSHSTFHDGAPRKGTKSKFFAEIYGHVPPKWHPPQDQAKYAGIATILDTMALVQKAPKQMQPGDPLVAVLRYALEMGLNEALRDRAAVAMYACDGYAPYPKDMEAAFRASGKEITQFQVIRGRADANTTPTLGYTSLVGFLKDGANKRQLLAHLEDEAVLLLNSDAKWSFLDKVVILNPTGPGTWVTITRASDNAPWKALAADPTAWKLLWQEADQLLLCAAKWWLARATSHTAVLVCDDTDLGVAVATYVDEVRNNKNLVLVRGTAATRKRIDVNEAIGRFKIKHGDRADLLLSLATAFHCFTGCDTNSYLYGHPKVACWETLLSLDAAEAPVLESLSKLGTFADRGGVLEAQRRRRARCRRERRDDLV